jgi:hypothetical protein
MQLKVIILSALAFVLCGLVFVWGMIATFRPNHLRRYEARITHIDRFGIRPAEYKRGPGIAVAGLIAMLISVAGIIQAVDICLDQLSPNGLVAALARPHGVTLLQPIVGVCLVLFGAILLIVPSLLLRVFPRAYPAQDTTVRPHRPSIPAKMVSIFPIVLGVWMIILWLRS